MSISTVLHNTNNLIEECKKDIDDAQTKLDFLKAKLNSLKTNRDNLVTQKTSSDIDPNFSTVAAEGNIYIPNFREYTVLDSGYTIQSLLENLISDLPAESKARKLFQEFLANDRALVEWAGKQIENIEKQEKNFKKIIPITKNWLLNAKKNKNCEKMFVEWLDVVVSCDAGESHSGMNMQSQARKTLFKLVMGY